MREMWPWRDWVIAAFNRNLRVDDFITWQLAGDLLPNPTQEQRIATGFNRNHMQSQEGGIVAEEYRTEYVVDRVNTLGRAFLGLSVECARCHDHKYDPVSQREFYRLYGFFNNVNEVGQIPYSGVPSPTAIVTTPEADAKLAALAARITTLEAELDPDRGALRRRLRALARDRRRRGARGRGAAARPHRPLPVRRAASGDRAAQGRSEEAAAAGEAAGRQEAAQADPGARQRRGRQGARPRRRHRSPDEDGARQGRRRRSSSSATASSRPARRSRSSSATSRSRSASGSASIAPARPARCSRDRAA